MLSRRLHTPEGTSDLLQTEAYRLHRVRNDVMKIFSGYGYTEVTSPEIEYYDVFAGSQGLLTQEKMIKFFDREGRILVLRPDLTTPLVRLTATKLGTGIHKLCYAGKVFRNYQGGIRPCETSQAGIELIGLSGAEADAEVIAASIRALQSCGLKDFQIEIGQVEIFKELMAQTGLEPDVTEQIRIFIDQKNIFGVQELLEHYDVPNELAELILKMPSLYGGREILQQAARFVTGKRTENAIQNLREGYEILEEYGLEEYVSLDLAMVQSLDYYTGLIFKGFARGVGFEVCAGGRYDRLMSRFGKDAPATGAALYLDLLADALYRQGVLKEPEGTAALVCGTNTRAARQIAEQLRSAGVRTEYYLDKGNPEEYARNKGIPYLYRCDDETLEKHNLLSGKKQTLEGGDLA